MVVRVEQVDSALIETVCERVRERVRRDAAAQIEEFVRQYYKWVPPEDLVGRTTLDLYGAALAHWTFLDKRPPGTTKVRVYNPDFEQHGWQSTHTVVEIATEDMPFVVDSTIAELTRRSYGIHLLIHPVVQIRRDEEGRFLAIGEGEAESAGHFKVDRQPAPAELDALRGHLERVLAEVRAA